MFLLLKESTKNCVGIRKLKYNKKIEKSIFSIDDDDILFLHTLWISSNIAAVRDIHDSAVLPSPTIGYLQSKM